MASSKPSGDRRATCPICGSPTEQAYRPFCSRRCGDVDLSRWLRGAYAIPDAESEDGDSEPDTAREGADPGKERDRDK